jgi:SPRY domain
MFWGYICLCARKCGPEGVLTKYGQSAKIGDVIGVLLEFRGGVGTLSFYRNGAKCGEAFSNLTGTLYPAVSLLYGEVQVTLDPKAAFPIN